jgi:hypothetical protein
MNMFHNHWHKTSRALFCRWITRPNGGLTQVWHLSALPDAGKLPF